jgi:hypothetical protein
MSKKLIRQTQAPEKKMLENINKQIMIVDIKRILESVRKRLIVDVKKTSANAKTVPAEVKKIKSYAGFEKRLGIKLALQNGIDF